MLRKPYSMQTSWTRNCFATKCFIVCLSLIMVRAILTDAIAQDAVGVMPKRPFGDDFPNLDSLAVGEWWKRQVKGPNPPPSMDVPRSDVIGFALYTHDHGILKMTAQLFPLRPNEEKSVRLELWKNDKWTEVAAADVTYPGWSAHFRIESWNSTQDVRYRLRHGTEAQFEGVIRRDPIEHSTVVVASMSCNSSRTTGMRPEIIERLKQLNPDLLFFAGDQTYRHTEHTAGWLEFGLQFRDVMRDRPTITIPDDHDVGHPNLWGENGRKSTLSGNADGGYFYPVDYVNMVQRQQTWHLPDPADPLPVERGLTVYFTRVRVGGVDFAVIEDRKFKSGPAGRIPQMGPRPDHINDPTYDPKSIDLPGLELLGKRQMKFLQNWGEDWRGAEMKAVLSQTAFCGAVHMHGTVDGRLLADLDCNGWPQSQRDAALREIRKVWGVHLCGDQHLAVAVKHGIDAFGDGPYAFTSPALVNTIYGRWWHPENEKAGANSRSDTQLPWTGDYFDGLGNRLTMLAYANPGDVRQEKERGDGFGVVRFDKKLRQVTFECWPRFATAKIPNQYEGWPLTIDSTKNDGRKVVGWLPEIVVQANVNPVVQVIDEGTGEVLYTVRAASNRFRPRVYSEGNFTVRVGRDRPDQKTVEGLKGTQEPPTNEIVVELQ